MLSSKAREKEIDMMRERERSPPRERNNEEWQTIKRRRRQSPPKNPPTARKTIFIDYLPLEIKPQTLSFIFLPHGRISTIIIPAKLREKCNHRFAFIKFFSTQSLLSAISHENGRRIGKFKLKVNPAKFDSPSQTTPSHPILHKPSHLNPTTNNEHHRSLRDQRSYKDVTIPNPPHTNPRKPTPHHDPEPQDSPHQHIIQPNQILEPPPEIFKKEMSNIRLMSSRVLGEETEKLREKIELDEMDGDQILSIKGSRNGENDELFARSVIAVANSSSSSETIHSHILAEGVNCLKIKPLGGVLHLITFETKEDKESIIESNWLLRWFMEIRNVNRSCAARWRQTWVTIYGVPLSAWNYENFFNIGNVYGRVLSVNYSRMDYAKVLIITDCFFLINNPLILDINGDKFKIFVMEESSMGSHVTNVTNEMGKVHNSEKDKQEIHAKNNQEDLIEASEEVLQSDEELQVLGRSSGRPIPNQEEESERSPVDLGRDDNDYPFNDTLGTPNKPAHQHFPLSFSKLSTIPPTSKPSPKKTLLLGPNKGKESQISPNGSHSIDDFSATVGPLNQSQSPLPSLEKIQLIVSPPKSTIPSKLNLDQANNLNLHLSPPKTQTYCQPSYPDQNPIIHLSNTFSPLRRKPEPKSMSTSSSISGPSIPPGFENFIPSPVKTLREKRRTKKLQKKKERRQRNLMTKSPQKKPTHSSTPSSSAPNPNESVDSIAAEIIDLGLKMGMNFNGPLSELHNKIRCILTRQNQDWANNQ